VVLDYLENDAMTGYEDDSTDESFQWADMASALETDYQYEHPMSPATVAS
jgi:hypothetical protein